MSRLNHRPTKIIEEPVPVAVTRAKLLRRSTAPPPAIKPHLVGIFYQQEVASYRLPRSLWQPSASDKQQFAMGKAIPTAIDSYLRQARTKIQNALIDFKNAASKIAMLKEEDSNIFKGYKTGLADNKTANYKIWGEIIMGNGGIMETLNDTNAVLKPINAFMAEHSGDGWDVQIARFLEIEQDQAEKIQEQLIHLKKQHSAGLLLRTANSELSAQIKASEDADNEALAEKRLRDQELTDMIKQHEKELNALINKNNDDAARKTREIIAKRQEILLDSAKVSRLIKKGLMEDRKEVAKSVTEFTNTIVKPADEDTDSG